MISSAFLIIHLGRIHIIFNDSALVVDMYVDDAGLIISHRQE